MNTYYTYIVTNKKRGIPYTGITNDLIMRTWLHKKKVIKGFTSRYNLDKLVWFEEFEWVHDAIAREKEIKGWSRQKKIDLIESFNPDWRDLYYDLIS
jgi:putative endonuclease